MTLQVLQHEPVVSDAQLGRFVSRALAAEGEKQQLCRLERKLSQYHSSFAIEEVTVHFVDGTRLPLIFKDLNSKNLVDGARDVRPQLDRQPAREAWVYSELLANAQLGTAVCYGNSVDAANQRGWLLLEKVDGTELARCGDFSVWIAAAGWLATAHGRLIAAAKEPRVSDMLHVYDLRCFDRWVDQAERTLCDCDVYERRAIAKWDLKQMLERARVAARLISAIPSEVIHGDFYPSNILVDRRADDMRICAVDWETAGIGPGLLDLAALIAGNWSEAQKRELAKEYLALRSQERPAPEFPRHALTYCRLLLAMKWIGAPSGWQPPPEHRYDWLAEALELARRLNSEFEEL